MTITEALADNSPVIQFGHQLTARRTIKDNEPQSRYFVLPSGRKMRIRHDSSLNALGALFIYHDKAKELLIGSLARKHIFDGLMGNVASEEIVRNGAKHEYTHRVVGEAFEQHPDLVSQLYTALQSNTLFSLSRQFAVVLIANDAYRPLYTMPEGNKRTTAILHEFLAFASEGETEETHSFSPAIVRAAVNVMKQMQQIFPDLYAHLQKLGIVNNSDFDRDYPMLLKHTERVALRAELKAQLRR